jgi:zinc and cadmium transporter
LHGGWSRTGALAYNFLSGLTFLLGALVVYSVSPQMNVDFLIPFAAGNFLYIGAADLIPEIKTDNNLWKSAVHFLAFAAGVGALLALRLYFPHQYSG